MSSRTVLIVDDDPFIRKLVATTLQDVSGFELVQAGDGLEAVDKAQEVTPELIFLDVDMPRMNGIDACTQLRASAGGKDATIVMLTASQDSEERARQAGADLFLTKPFSPLDLLRLVDELGS